MDQLLDMPHPDELERRLAEARGGSLSALERALESHVPFLRELAGQRSSPDSRAERASSDLVRLTLRRAHEGFGRFEGRSEPEFRAWLCRLMLETAASLRETESEIEPSGPEAPLKETAELGRRGLAPTVDAAEALREAIDRLAETDRQVILWRHRDHLTFEEIAARLGLSASETSLVWVRAIEQLERRLDEIP